MARGLRAFYASEGIHPELLKLDQELHLRLASAESAAMLAETQLAMSQDADAIATLTGLESSKATDKTQALLGIALARGGQTDRAKQIAEGLRLPDDATPSLKYAAARLYASIGDTTKATAMLKACFESTLPSQLDGFKSHAKACPEFAAMASSAAFAGVLETQSKMPESKCSGGSSCAGCPMKGKCPMSQGK
jgi:thioredoxin-like negative regulator of GroEL